MKIEVYGPGCSKCQNTGEIIRRVAQGMGVAVEVEKVSNLEAILAKGLLRTPAVFVDGRKVCEGKVPSENEIKKWLRSLSV